MINDSVVLSKFAIICSFVEADEDEALKTIDSFSDELIAGNAKLYLALDGGAASDLFKRAIYNFSHIKLIEFPDNAGLTKRLNDLIDISCEPYIARIDAGDTFCRDRLKRQEEILDKYPACGQSGSFKGDVLTRCDQMYMNHCVHSSMAFRRENTFCQMRYDEDMYYAQDYELWMRLLSGCGSIHIAKKPYCERHAGRPGITELKYRQQIKTAHKIRLKYGLNPIKSSFYSLKNLLICEAARVLQH